MLAPDPVLESALKASSEAGLPEISVSQLEGQLLFVLARMQSAQTVLEVGTLGGYSTIWLARAVSPNGRLVTLEIEPAHAEVAGDNLVRAGMSKNVDVRVGPALKILPQLVDEYPTGFDMVFIDADKTGYPDYWHWALKLAHVGTLIVADNVVRDGAVADPANSDPSVEAIRHYLKLVAAEPRVCSTVIQTVGPKGYDGLSLALVVDEAPTSAS